MKEATLADYAKFVQENLTNYQVPVSRDQKVKNANYLAGDSWKCPKSPTGAHHWIISKKIMECCFCHIQRGIRGNDTSLHKIRWRA